MQGVSLSGWPHCQQVPAHCCQQLPQWNRLHKGETTLQQAWGAVDATTDIATPAAREGRWPPQWPQTSAAGVGVGPDGATPGGVTVWRVDRTAAPGGEGKAGRVDTWVVSTGGQHNTTSSARLPQVGGSTVHSSLVHKFAFFTLTITKESLIMMGVVAKLLLKITQKQMFKKSG